MLNSGGHKGHSRLKASLGSIVRDSISEHIAAKLCTDVCNEKPGSDHSIYKELDVGGGVLSVSHPRSDSPSSTPNTVSRDSRSSQLFQRIVDAAPSSMKIAYPGTRVANKMVIRIAY